MGRHDDDDIWDQKLRDAFHRHTDDLVFTREMEQRVLAKIATKADGQSSHSPIDRTPLLQRLTKRRVRVWSAGMSGIAACIIAAVWGVTSWQQVHTAKTAGTMNTFGGLHLVGSSAPVSHGSTFSQQRAIPYAGIMKQAVADIPTSLAPVESRYTRLIPGITHQALEQQTANSAMKASTSTKSKTSDANHFVQLGRQEFTVSTQLYNNSLKPLDGRDLQGMLFVLNQPTGVTPVRQADWEYFVDGPQAVIPPHQSTPWDFTPNPAPSYQTLKDRTVHLIWMFRTPDPSFPTFYLGTLPVQTAGVRLQITGTTTGATHTQFLRVTAMLTNKGAHNWDMRSALGLLFFDSTPGASLLSRGTYKYFDDVAPVIAGHYVLRPGQTVQAQFIITGVPGTDMRRLPLTILLVARKQIGA